MILKRLDKQSVLYIIVIIIIAVLVCVGFFYYRSLISEPEIEEDSVKKAKRARILNQLKQKEETTLLPREEILEQMKSK